MAVAIMYILTDAVLSYGVLISTAAVSGKETTPIKLLFYMFPPSPLLSWIALDGILSTFTSLLRSDAVFVPIPIPTLYFVERREV